MTKFLDYLLSGLTQGVIYAALALALVLIWRSTRVLNFAQGSMAMLSVYVAVTVVDRGWGYWWAFAAALATGLVLGAALEWIVVRRVEHAPPLNAVVVTLGLFVVLEAAAGLIWGSNSRTLPTPFAITGYTVGRHTYLFGPMALYALAAVAALCLGLVALFRFTRLGLAMRATALAPEVARLVGVRVGRLLTLGWALAAVIGAVAGMLVATPLSDPQISPAFLEGANIIGFTAAILGGLDSPVGAVVGGIGIGLALAFISGYLDPSLALPGALLILVVVLMLRPQGLFSRAKARVV